MNRSLTCMQCGFMTCSYEDMVFHLACEQRYEEEDCNKKVIGIGSKEYII